MNKLVTLLSNTELSAEEIERIVVLRNYFEGATEQVKELCTDHPERTVALRLLEESMTCAIRAIKPEENPFLKNNMTKRGAYMKKNPTRWEKKMKDAGLSAPFEPAESKT